MGVPFRGGPAQPGPTRATLPPRGNPPRATRHHRPSTTDLHTEDSMSARAEALAKQFETKAAEMADVLEKLTDADWKKTTAAEKWTVGVTAHHAAGAHEPIAGIAKTVASGQSLPNFTMGMLDEMNDKHAKDFARCNKAETLEVNRTGVWAV